MSKNLLMMVERFVSKEITAEVFAEQFIAAWKRERESGDALLDSAHLSEKLSSIFCFADMFNPAPDKDEYELDEAQLLAEVTSLISGHVTYRCPCS